MTTDPARTLYAHSAWSHGYIHGYEQGFHTGNIDYHMGRGVREVRKIKESHQEGKFYHDGFGSRSEFGHGFGSGFQVGYLDAMTGMKFRAASIAMELATDLSSSSDATSESAKSDAKFDETLAGAYEHGRESGLRDARSDHEYAPGTVCPASPTSKQSCSAYQIGYRWGYADGFSNQKPDRLTRTASR